LKKIIKKAKSLFEKPPKEPQYTIKLSPQVWAKLPDLTKKQIAETLARETYYKQKYLEALERIRELEGKKKPEEIKMLEKALAEQKKLRKKKEGRRLKLIFPSSRSVCYYDMKPIKTKSGKIHRYIVGIEIEETESGTFRFLNFLTSENPAKVNLPKSIGRISPTPTISASDFFSIPFIVPSLKFGKVILPVYSDGTSINLEWYLKPVHPTTKSEDTKRKKRGKSKSKKEAEGLPTPVPVPPVSMLSTIEAYQKEIAELKRKLEVSESRRLQAEKLVADLEEMNRHLEDELIIAKRRADAAWAKASSETKIVKNILGDYAGLLIDSMTSEVNRRLTQAENLRLAEHIRTLRSELEKAYGKPIDEEVWDRIEGKLMRWFSQAVKLKQPIVVPKPVERREETKKKKGG